MSLAFADPAPPPEFDLPDPMPDGVGRPGLALSVALHLVLGSLFIFGLPTLFHPPHTAGNADRGSTGDDGAGDQGDASQPKYARARGQAGCAGAGSTWAEAGARADPASTGATTFCRRCPASAALAGAGGAEAGAISAPASAPRAQAGAAAPPKPIAKVEAPQPAPEKPQRIARPQAKAEAKKYDPGQFDALLKNLAAQDTAPSPDQPPRKMRVALGAASSQPRAPLGSQLSASELDMIREQIARCWNIPAGARDAKDLVVELRVVVEPDGMVQQATIVDQGRLAGDPFFRAAAESARRAFFNPLCRPLRLPPDKYDVWKDMVVDFSPKDLL